MDRETVLKWKVEDVAEALRERNFETEVVDKFKGI